MKARNTVWWCVFFIVGISLQGLWPGIDVLVVGLLLSLQEKSRIQRLWVFLVLLLVQEGAGTLDFGSSILWYGSVVGIFYLGRWLFETENFLFMFLLSACLGASHFGVVRLMCSLQYIPVNVPALLDECVLQALFIPFAWKLAAHSRQWVVHHEDSA